jgi:hypothetical protein
MLPGTRIFQCILLAASVLLGDGEGRVVVTVDGAGIVRNEIDFALAPFRAAIADLRERGTAAEKESAAKAMVDSAISHAIVIKIQQLLAVEKGIISDPSYPAFRQKWQEENSSRRTAIGKGDVVYGPAEFTEAAFYDYNTSNILSQLKSSFAKENVDITDQRLRARYDSLRERMFRMPDAMTFLRIDVPLSESGQLDDLRKDIVDGRSIDEMLQQYRCSVDTITAGEWKSLNGGEDVAAITQKAGLLRSGEVSSWMREEDMQVVLKCLTREPAGFIPFEQVRATLRAQIIDSEFDGVVKQRRVQTVVSVDSSEYRRLLSDLPGAGK